MRHRALAFSLLIALLSACGGPTIADFPPDEKLVDLSGDQLAVVCDWFRQQAAAKLPPSGTVVSCGGRDLAITWSTCAQPVQIDSTCAATVSDATRCFPPFLDALAADPCSFLGARSLTDFE